jgi:hypothetical protein
MSALTHRLLNPALLGACALSAIAVAGCGGSGSSASANGSKRVATASTSSARPDRVTSGTTTDRAAKTPVRSDPDIGGATKQRVVKHGSHTDAAQGGGSGVAHSSDKLVKSGGSQKARQVSIANDDNTGASSHQLDPCGLVTLPQAQTFAGGAISSRFEAPQGPTCIYKPANAKTEITLALETMSASQVTDHLGQRQKLTVAGRTAYCGKLGQQLLIVPLPGGQLLSVGAPCTVARQFAQAALGRLGA